ncbi:hypothetical protein [Sulfitobacter aestuariivivens]
MKRCLIAAAAFALSLAHPAQAADLVQTNNTNAVWFENWTGLSKALMRVATPEGDISDVRADRGTPVYQLSANAVDGVYRYELRAATEEMVKNRDYQSGDLNGGDEEYIPEQLYITGHFVVERGAIIGEMEEEEGDN